MKIKSPYAGGCWLCLFLAASNTEAQNSIATSAPIDNPGMTVVVDAGGVQAHGFQFTNCCQKPTPWDAQWIWLSGEATERGWFRKEITLDTIPNNIPAWMSADMKYRLWINGKLASRGPADIGRD